MNVIFEPVWKKKLLLCLHGWSKHL